MPASIVRQPVPTGGLVTSTPSDHLAPEQSPQLRNVRFRYGAVQPLPGRELLGSKVDSLPRSIARFSVDDQTKWLVMLTDNGMWKWGDIVPGTPANWVKVPGPVLGGVGRWDWATGEDCFFFARDGAGGVWVWPGTGAYYKLAGAGVPEQARFVEYFNNRLLAGSVVINGERWSNRVMWPMNGDFTNWTGDGSGSLDFYEPEQEPLQGLKVLGNRCVVFREHSLTDMVATGTLSPVFMSEQRTVNVGTMFPSTITSNGLALFFLGNDGNVWAWNGSTLTPIGNPIQKTLEQIIDISQYQEYVGMVFPFKNEFWLWIGNGKLVIFDFLQGRWMLDEFPNLAAMGDAQLAQRQLTWGEATLAWNTYPTWAELRRSYDLRMIAGRTDYSTVSCGEGIVGMEDGRVYTCEIQTPDTYFDPQQGPFSQGTVVQTMLTYEFNNDVDLFEIALSGDRGNTWTVVYHQPNPVGYGIVSWKHTSNVLRTRLRSTGVRPSFQWVELLHEIVPAGPYAGLDQVVTPGLPLQVRPTANF
jgi:hypothetical protein